MAYARIGIYKENLNASRPKSPKTPMESGFKALDNFGTGGKWDNWFVHRRESCGRN
jgi:hypothetical protein